MRCHTPFAGLALAAGLAACGTTSDETRAPTSPAAEPTAAATSPAETSAGAVRTVHLAPGARITVRTDISGRTAIAVFAGDRTYRSTSPHLASGLAEICELMGRRGHVVWIEVTEGDEILSVAHQVTLEHVAQ